MKIFKTKKSNNIWMSIKDKTSNVFKKNENFFMSFKNKIVKVFKREEKQGGFKLIEVIIIVSIVMIIGVLAGVFITYKYIDKENNAVTATYDNNVKEFNEAYQYVINNYYENIDKSKLIDAAINGMVSILDGHTSYMTPEQTKAFEEVMDGEYKGIGIAYTSSTTGVHLVTNVLADSPALAAGIKKGDIISKLDGIDATKKTGTEIASYIKESTASSVTLVILRDSKLLTFKVDRKVVAIPSVTKEIYERNGKKIGYIYISVFANNTYSQFKTALESLEADKISSLVIDVRDNSGGYLRAASDILELFLEKDKVMYQMQNKTQKIKYTDSTIESRKYPISVLINGNSASSSEILAAGLKESYNATLVGNKSYGKGTVQQPNTMSNGGLIKITTSKWLTPTGTFIDKVGITPTTIVDLSDNYFKTPTTDNDNQLQTALDLISK